MPEGEFVCIIGHSGCGKSTVLSIVMGLNEATQGGVMLGGREISGPATTVRERLTVPFPRPCSRTAVLQHPRYYPLRDQLISFLEERAAA
jgi:ABC-type cobalamin/Fe3+-siderophores transport system ATPase subunit